MDNENKDFLTDEEKAKKIEEQTQKMKDDVSSKIADAAAEVKEEIEDANANAEVEAEAEQTADTLENAFSEVKIAEPEKQKKSVNISVGALVGIIVGCVAAAAIVVILCMNFFGPGKAETYGNKAEGKTLATVDGEKLTDADLGYYIYAEAMNQYYEVAGDQADGDMSDFDWDQEVDGKKLSDTIKENAYNDAVDDLVTIQQGSPMLADDDKWSEQDEAQANAQISGYISQYGEDGFELRARTMGLKSANEYGRIYKRVMQVQTVQSAMEDDVDKFKPEGVDLSEHVRDDRATVKHVLIKTVDPNTAMDPAASPDPDAVDDATGLATAQTVAQQAKEGTDFDQLIEQYNKDPGETSAGYTFETGEMMPEFETAAFALKLDEVSDPVKTDYGYHVIKRLAGPFEIQGYWKSQAKIKENKSNLDKIDVAAVMSDIQAATEQLEAEAEAAQQSAQGNSSSAGE